MAQIHGTLDVYPSWRLTKAHYEQLMQQPGYLEALKQLFLRHVFFVGFGLHDDDLDLLLATLAHIYPAGVGEFYALLARPRKSDPIVQHLVRENGLRPIFYEVDQQPRARGAGASSTTTHAATFGAGAHTPVAATARMSPPTASARSNDD